MDIAYLINRECDTMIYPSIDKLLNIVSSKYELVHIISKRSREMHENSYYQLKEDEYRAKKNLGRALEEVADSLIQVK